jgi:hypothetical protein
MSDDEYWAFAKVDCVGPRPRLWTTEPSVVDQVLAELQTLIPSARVADSDPTCEMLGIRWMTFDRLQGMDKSVSGSIFAILCRLGWEPFSEYELRDFTLRKRCSKPNA